MQGFLVQPPAFFLLLEAFFFGVALALALSDAFFVSFSFTLTGTFAHALALTLAFALAAPLVGLLLAFAAVMGLGSERCSAASPSSSELFSMQDKSVATDEGESYPAIFSGLSTSFLCLTSGDETYPSMKYITPFQGRFLFFSFFMFGSIMYLATTASGSYFQWLFEAK